MAQRIPVHVALMGAPGAGKSTLAASFPKRMVVLSTDPIGKESPYLRRGRPAPAREGPEGQSIIEVASRKSGQTIIVVERYLDANPRQPNAHSQLLARLQMLPEEVARGDWATVVFDGVTFGELNCRKHYQYHEHSPYRASKEPRRWFAAATDDLEEMLMQTLGALPCNVVVICHIDREKDESMGTFLHNPAAPGRLRTRFAAAYPEVYHVYAMRDAATGEIRHYVQTRPDGRFAANSVLLEAPDNCVPDYAALWVNYDARAAADTRECEKQHQEAAERAQDGVADADAPDGR